MTIQKTGFLLSAIQAPIAAGKPNPIVPEPPDVINFLVSLNFKYLAAHT